MIYLITGAVNQGKSTRLLSIYRSLKIGEGFYNRKIYRGDTIVGQEIVDLATGESKLFSYREGYIPRNWDEECRYQSFSFSRAGLDFGREIIRNALDSAIGPIFLDEIGPLELEGKGFCKIFMRLLAAPVEMYIVVRIDCLKDVVKKFLVKNYREININSSKLELQ